jgi:hypothetical protein
MPRVAVIGKEAHCWRVTVTETVRNRVGLSVFLGLLVDRLTGRVSQFNLPEFDPFYSTASWYRDCIAYCGVSEDGKKLYAVVAQVGRRKPILKKDAGEPAVADDPDSDCPAPVWERTPMRVTFQPGDKQKLVFSIRSRVVDVVNDAEEPEE